MSLTCRICGESLATINAYHLKKHGMTVEEYENKYGPTTPNHLSVFLQNTSQQDKEFLLASASPTAFAQVMHNSLQIFDKRFQEKAKLAAGVLLEQRLQEHARASLMYTKIIQILDERISDPVAVALLDVKELTSIANVLQSEMGLTMKSALSLLNSVVQDQKSVVNKPQSNIEHAFTGEKNTLEIPDMQPQDRDRARRIIEQIMKRVVPDESKSSE